MNFLDNVDLRAALTMASGPKAVTLALARDLFWLRPQMCRRRPDGRFIRGLNTIRFFCALWVVMGHYGAPPLPAAIDKTTNLGWAVNGLYNNLTSGPAAVIVFFVISGCCIHFPYSRANRIGDLAPYFVRRFLRILPPMIVAMLISKNFTNVKLGLLGLSVLWSLQAELIYYLIYPVLFEACRRLSHGWDAMIVVSFVIALALAATNPGAGNYPSYGLAFNWLLGLPCWMMGCKLAEKINEVTNCELKAPIWIWRGGIVLLATLCSVARFHLEVGYPWTLNFFAIAAAFWLYREVEHFSRAEPPKLLEWAGNWSYSLYLVHPIGMAFFLKLPLSRSGSLADWIAHMGFICLFALSFAALVELPSHKLARCIARRLGGNCLAQEESTWVASDVPAATEWASTPKTNRAGADPRTFSQKRSEFT